MSHKESIYCNLLSLLSGAQSVNKYACSSLSDNQFLLNGIQRVRESVSSGRDFLQQLSDKESVELARSTLFSAFKSKRRLLFVREVAQNLYKIMNKELLENEVNYLSDFPELNDYDVFSGDGHFIEHACHAQCDPKTGKRYAAGNIFIKNMRTGLMQQLVVAGFGPEKHHEIKLFRKAANFKFRTINVLDRAYIDNAYWYQKSAKEGVEIVCLCKSSQKVIKNGVLRFDREDPFNDGVISDELVAFSSGQTLMRMVQYVNPEDGQKYDFFTTILDEKIRPGVIAHLYFLRWQIEKSYDVFKNELKEKKAWVTSETGTEIQAHFISIYFNFLLYFQEKMKIETGLGDKKCEEKYENALTEREEKSKEKGGHVRPILKLKNRMARLSAQFIRLIKNIFCLKMTKSELYERYMRRVTAYL